MSDELTTSEILDAAADCVEHVGWHRGAFACNARGHDRMYDDDDAVAWCALGATGVASSGLDCGVAADMALEALLGSVQAFNDAPGRTATEVAMAMREAAERVREGRA